MILTYAPLTTWPGELTQHREEPRFRSDWDSTLRLLGDEVDKLVYPPHGDRHAVATMHLPTDARFIRKDGTGLLAGVEFYHPGCMLTVRDAEGRELKFPSDRYARTWGQRQPWRDNAHAIALTLKHLRDLERWGVASESKQYAGFRAMLGSGIAVGQAEDQMTPAEAAAYLAEASDGFKLPAEIQSSATVADETYRVAAHLHHPDKPTGNSIVFAKAGKAIAVLRKENRR